jgi:hypothetical protein
MSIDRYLWDEDDLTLTKAEIPEEQVQRAKKVLQELVEKFKESKESKK